MLHIHTEIIQDGKGEIGKYEEPLDLSVKDLWLHVTELVNENPEHRYVYHFIEKNNERDTNINGVYIFEYTLFVITETAENMDLDTGSGFSDLGNCPRNVK